MNKTILILFFFFGFCQTAWTGTGDSKFGRNFPGTDTAFVSSMPADESALDIYCLRQAYSQIEKVERQKDQVWLVLNDGQKIPYDFQTHDGNYNNVSLKESMAQLYPLEPARPEPGAGYSPGRKRNQAFMEALYGQNNREVQKKLLSVRQFNKTIRLTADAARALLEILPGLEELWQTEPAMRPYLAPGGGQYWRKIAGEERLSPHAFGLALDMGIKAAPYWRWAKINPHPKQKTYPSEIVKLFEDAGFIWGGKWHEYDLMHFEYRPELICKAKILARKNFQIR